MKRFYGRIYSPSEGVIEEYLILAGDGKEAARGMVSYLALRVLRGEDDYPDDAHWNVMPLWMAYRQGLLVNAEVAGLEVIDAGKLIEELQDFERKRSAGKQLTLAEVVS